MFLIFLLIVLLQLKIEKIPLKVLWKLELYLLQDLLILHQSNYFFLIYFDFYLFLFIFLFIFDFYFLIFISYLLFWVFIVTNLYLDQVGRLLSQEQFVGELIQLNIKKINFLQLLLKTLNFR